MGVLLFLLCRISFLGLYLESLRWNGHNLMKETLEVYSHQQEFFYIDLMFLDPQMVKIHTPLRTGQHHCSIRLTLVQYIFCQQSFLGQHNMGSHMQSSTIQHFQLYTYYWAQSRQSLESYRNQAIDSQVSSLYDRCHFCEYTQYLQWVTDTFSQQLSHGVSSEILYSQIALHFGSIPW